MKPCRHEEYVEGCRLCQLHRDSPEYRRLFDELGTREQPRCKHMWKRVRDEKGEIKKLKCEAG